MQPDNGAGGNWTFRQEGQTQAAPVDPYQQAAPTNTQPEGQVVSWTASEFIAHHKDSKWYTSIIAGAAMLCIVVYLLTRDLISVISISVVLVLFLIISGKKPDQRSYQVDEQGISIGNKFYPYSDFKSFALQQEGAIGYISFTPLKRFMPEISIYYAPEDEGRIIDVLSLSLPNDQRAEKATDRLAKRLRF